MRGINAQKSRKKRESEKAKGFQKKFYLIVGIVTLILAILVYLAYSSY
ncbi:MAG TPA: hypothetical protein VKZ56_08695 [Membranihabitans sp.]|nr:hypothetical protein [Membranihabitans sp.]